VDIEIDVDKYLEERIINDNSGQSVE